MHLRCTVGVLVAGETLAGAPPERFCDVAEVLFGESLAMLRPCSAGDVLVHEGAAHVVGAGPQDLLSPRRADLHPRHLDVVDESVVGDPRHGMHQQRLPEGRAAARTLAQVDRARHVHERKRNPFGEPAGALLQLTRRHDVVRPVLGLFDRSEHDRDVRVQAHRMRRLMAFQPLGGVDLVGAQHSPHRVVEDLRSGARKRLQPGLLQTHQVVHQRLAEPLGALDDLESGEAVQVHVGHDIVDGPADVDVVVAVEAGVNAALQGHLGGAQLGGLDHPLLDVGQRQHVGRAPQVQRQGTLGETAELALERAHVRVVDVAVVHPGHDVAHGLAAQLVGDLAHGDHLGATGTKQRDDFVVADLLARHHTVEHLSHGATGKRGPAHDVRGQVAGTA